MVGAWEINVNTDYPQKVATAIAELSEELFGAEYKPIAYLGSQVVNGINHAVLAEQTVLNGKDTKNAVVIVFNEKPSSMDVSLVSINTIVHGSDGLGGIKIDMDSEIPANAKDAFAKAMEGFVGSKIEPFAYIGMQVVKGINYIMMAELTPVVEHPVKTLALITVNDFEGNATFAEIKKFDNGQGDHTLGYAFTW